MARPFSRMYEIRVELLKKEIDCNNISFGIVSEETGIPVKRVERIYYNDLPKEDEMRRILEWIGSYRDWETDRKSTRLNSSHSAKSRMPSSA